MNFPISGKTKMNVPNHQASSVLEWHFPWKSTNPWIFFWGIPYGSPPKAPPILSSSSGCGDQPWGAAESVSGRSERVSGPAGDDNGPRCRGWENMDGASRSLLGVARFWRMVEWFVTENPIEVDDDEGYRKIYWDTSKWISLKAIWKEWWIGDIMEVWPRICFLWTENPKAQGCWSGDSTCF